MWNVQKSAVISRSDILTSSIPVETQTAGRFSPSPVHNTLHRPNRGQFAVVNKMETLHNTVGSQEKRGAYDTIGVPPPELPGPKTGPKTGK